MDDLGVEWGSCLYEEQDYEIYDIGGYYDYGDDIGRYDYGADVEEYYHCRRRSSLEEVQVDDSHDDDDDDDDDEEDDDDDDHEEEEDEECASSIRSFRSETSYDDKVEEVKNREKWIEHYSSSERILGGQGNYYNYNNDDSLDEDCASSFWSETSSYNEEQVEKREIWIGQYSSSQSILLVGEGNYSFSLSLAKAFRSARNIVATSLDSLQDLGKKYNDGVVNVMELEEMGGQALCGLDATQMRDHHFLTTQKFDRIVYNFPHVGFRFPEADGRQIKMNKELVKGFLRNAKVLLKKDTGEIHVTHKNGYPYDEWDLGKIMQEIGLVLHETVPFHKQTYPGYFNKRGHGRLSNDSFPLGRCTTYKFRLPQHLASLLQTTGSN